jgi:hypothetical protein
MRDDGEAQIVEVAAEVRAGLEVGAIEWASATVRRRPSGVVDVSGTVVRPAGEFISRWFDTSERVHLSIAGHLVTTRAMARIAGSSTLDLLPVPAAYLLLDLDPADSKALVGLIVDLLSKAKAPREVSP